MIFTRLTLRNLYRALHKPVQDLSVALPLIDQAGFATIR